MIKNAAYVAGVLIALYLYWVFTEVGPYLRPHLGTIWKHYSDQLVGFCACVFALLTLCTLLVIRMVWLKSSGDKLRHTDKELSHQQSERLLR